MFPGGVFLGKIFKYILCSLLYFKYLDPVPKLIDVVIKKKEQREHHWRMIMICGKV